MINQLQEWGNPLFRVVIDYIISGNPFTKNANDHVYMEETYEQKSN